MKINLKGKEGFTSVDLSIAMIIVIIFVVIMTSISSSAYSSSMAAKRKAVALNYAVDIFEHIGEIDIAEVKATKVLLDVDSLQNIIFEDIATRDDVDIVTGKIGTYEINVEVEDYRNDEVVKIITLKITYPVSKRKTETLRLQRIKAKEKTA